MTQDSSLTRRVAQSFLYSGIGTGLSKVLSVVAIFATLKFLSPEEFGIASIVFAIFSIVHSVTELGLGVALVQKKDLTKEQTDSLFWMALLISIAIYAILCGISPLLAWFYEDAQLTSLLIVYSLGLVLFSLYLVPRNLLIKDLKFGRIAVIDSVPVLMGSGGMVLLAWLGYGAWSVIWGELITRIGQLILCFLFRPYWPSMRLRIDEIRDMVSFGLYATGSRLLYNFYIQVDYLIVGKVFGIEAVGIYTLAYRVIADPVRTIASIINQVAYPVFAKLQDETESLKQYLFGISRASLILIGLVLTLIVVNIDLALKIGGYEQWLDSVPLIRAFALLGLVRTVSPLVPQLLNAKGMAKLNFIYSVCSSIIVPVGLIIGAQFSVMGVVWAWVVVYPAVVMVLYNFGAKLLNMSLPSFVHRLYSGLWVLTPAVVVGWGLRWFMESLGNTHPIAIVGISVFGILVCGLGIAWAIDGKNLRLLLKKKNA